MQNKAVESVALKLESSVKLTPFFVVGQETNLGKVSADWTIERCLCRPTSKARCPVAPMQSQRRDAPSARAISHALKCQAHLGHTDRARHAGCQQCDRCSRLASGRWIGTRALSRLRGIATPHGHRALPRRCRGPPVCKPLRCSARRKAPCSMGTAVHRARSAACRRLSNRDVGPPESFPQGPTGNLPEMLPLFPHPFFAVSKTTVICLRCEFARDSSTGLCSVSSVLVRISHTTQRNGWVEAVMVTWRKNRSG